MGPLAGASYLGRRRQCSDSRRERCTSLEWRRVSRWATRMGPSRSPPHSSSIPRGIPPPYLHWGRRRHQWRFREVVVSSEGDVRNALGESYMPMAHGGIRMSPASDDQYRGRKRSDYIMMRTGVCFCCWRRYIMILGQLVVSIGHFQFDIINTGICLGSTGRYVFIVQIDRLSFRRSRGPGLYRLSDPKQYHEHVANTDVFCALQPLASTTLFRAARILWDTRRRTSATNREFRNST